MRVGWGVGQPFTGASHKLLGDDEDDNNESADSWWH